MKRSSILLVVCLAALVTVLASCRTTQPPASAPADTRAQDESAIRAAAQDWGIAIADKNLDQTLSYYADDAWVYPQNAPIAKTADQRRSVWAAFFATPGASDMEGDITRVEVARSGDLAVEFGTFAMTMNDKKGKPITENEKYVVTWKKQADGKWKVIADIWNTDK
ncbi:MAG: SgcJ/EcaC family oxidoreductase [Acidobacteriia bacterium]|nr:SgcJ/EcaC family oxidoreductase [Terriglobia bacterium]